MILAKSAVAFQVVKLAGAAYLVWIGFQALRSGSSPGASESGTPSTLRAALREGFLTNLLNPKVAVFYLAFLPQFISPGDPVFAKSLLLASIHNALGIIWLGSLSVLARKGRDWIRRPAVGVWMSRVTGTLLVGLGLRLALEKR